MWHINWLLGKLRSLLSSYHSVTDDQNDSFHRLLTARLPINRWPVVRITDHLASNCERCRMTTDHTTRRTKANVWSWLRLNVPLFLVSGRTVKRIKCHGYQVGSMVNCLLHANCNIYFRGTILQLYKVRTVMYEPDDRATDIEISRRQVTRETTTVDLWQLPHIV
jgi:hypothetical protein